MKGFFVNTINLMQKSAEFTLCIGSQLLKLYRRGRQKYPRAAFVLHSLLFLYILFLLMNLLFPLPLERIEGDYSTAVLFESGEVNYVARSKNNTFRIYTPPDKITYDIIKCFIGYEDRFFYHHPGINPVSVIRAFSQNLRSGRIISGASTITMQIARMIEPKERTAVSKVIELFRAFQLETAYSKRELLSIYLNLIPLGGNLEGIGAGAHFYFNKQPSALSIGEIALLIGIPQSPNYARPDLFPENARKVRDKVLKRLYDADVVSEKEYNSAIKTNPRKKRFSLPFTAPHLVMKVLEENRGEKRVYLTIDRAMQATCEAIIAKYRQKLKDEGIKNTAILVVDNKTGAIKTWIGGFAYENAHESMIDAVTIKRSPASTLKPFIYGKALDAGLITPRYVLYDVERFYAGYRVENYDKTYYGPITAADALTRSLNSPAVYLLEKLHKGSLVGLMDSLGYEAAQGDHIGLSLALGAKEISLFELTRHYTLFSNGGRVKNIYYTRQNAVFPEKQIMSSEAAYLVSQMLSEGVRLDLPRSWEYSVHRGRIAWKTGTSFGNYDALCIGYNKDYTIGVWTGNADRTPSPNLVGVWAAAPIVFHIFNALVYDKGNWISKPESVKVRKVSAESGKIPSPYSPHIINDYYIPGISSMAVCGRFKKYLIDTETGLAVLDPAGRTVKEEIYEVYPPDAMPWIEKNLPSYVPPPLFEDRAIKSRKNTGKLDILSPLKNKVYYINKNIPLENQKIPLLTKHHYDSHRLFWFLDNTLIQSGSPGDKMYLTPTPGKHTIMCLDNKGRNGSVTLEIMLIE